MCELISSEAIRRSHRFYKGPAIAKYIIENPDEFKMKGVIIRKDGSVNIYLNVTDIPDSFETLYPIRYQFGNEKIKTVVYRLKAGENKIEFSPESSARVKEVKFNPNYDILEQ